MFRLFCALLLALCITPAMAQVKVELRDSDLILRDERGTYRVVNKQKRIFFEEVSCKCSYTSRCEDDIPLQATPGWQICELLFNKPSEGGANHDGYMAPTNFLPGDSENPPRFRSVKVHVFCSGSHNFFDQQGAWVIMKDVGFTEIPAGLTNQDRWENNCDLIAPKDVKR